jgi:hypothetical protein
MRVGEVLEKGARPEGEDILTAFALDNGFPVAIIVLIVEQVFIY